VMTAGLAAAAVAAVVVGAGGVVWVMPGDTAPSLTTR